MISSVYYGRECSFSCRYCAACRETPQPEMSFEQFQETLRILKELGTTQLMLQGCQLTNIKWGYEKLPTVLPDDIPYRLFDSPDPKMIMGLSVPFMREVKSVATGTDYFMQEWTRGIQHTQSKSFFSIRQMMGIRQDFPHVLCHSPIVLMTRNIRQVVLLLSFLQDNGISTELNVMHFNTDGGFDVFPAKETHPRSVACAFTDDYSFSALARLNDHLYLSKNRHKQTFGIEGLESFLSLPMLQGTIGVTNDVWHCGGDPTGGPTVDADGSLRLCPYRKGKTVSEMTVFDLGNAQSVSEWKRRVKEDAQACPGCCMTLPRTHSRIKGGMDVKEELVGMYKKGTSVKKKTEPTIFDITQELVVNPKPRTKKGAKK